LRLGRSDAGDFARSLAQASALKARVEGAGSVVDPQRELLAAYCALFDHPGGCFERIKGLRALGLRRQWAVRQWLLYLHACLMSPVRAARAASK
jgi:hypothetical protein